MLKIVLQLIAFFGFILRRILNKRDENKPAEEHLKEGSYTEAAREAAEKAADDKFGPDAGKDESPPAEEVEGAKPWYRIARKEIGVKEVTGKEHSARVLEYLSTCDNLGKWGRKRDETPWCAAFVGWCLEQAGYTSTRHALASSYINFGKPSRPVEGAIVVLKRKDANKDRATGSTTGYHVAFLVALQKNYIVLVGGNQRNSVRVSYYPRQKYNIVAMRKPVERLPNA